MATLISCRAFCYGISALVPWDARMSFCGDGLCVWIAGCVYGGFNKFGMFVRWERNVASWVFTLIKAASAGLALFVILLMLVPP
jgi:hypothetical protein